MKKFIFVLFFALIIFFIGAADTGAQEWTLLSSGVNNDLNNISCVDENTCYVVGGAPFIGGDGVVLKTTNGGGDWVRQTISTTDPLRGISCPLPSVCYAAGDNGAIIKTINGGTTWISQSAPNLSTAPGQARPWFWDIWATSERDVVAVGNNGAIYRTADSGITWQQIAAGVDDVNLNGVFFIDENIGWVLGGGLVLKTSDGGLTWARQTPTDAGALMWDAFSFDGSVVWLAGSTVHKTVNGGTNWSRLIGSTGIVYRGIEFGDENIGWIVGGGGTIKKTTDGGSNWATQSSHTGQTLRDIQCVGTTLCYAVGDDGAIVRYGSPPPPARPDLTISEQALTCPATEIGLEFAEYRYNIVARNAGEADARAFSVRLQGIDAAGNAVGTPMTEIVSGLDGGASTTITGQATTTFFNPTSAALVRVRATADILDQITETTEDNNSVIVEQTCAIATTPVVVVEPEQTKEVPVAVEQKPAEVKTEVKTETKAEAAKIQLEKIQQEAPKILLPVAEFLAVEKITRNEAKEDAAEKKVEKIIQTKLPALSEAKQETVKQAITTFVAYGTETTKVLGEGERAGVVNSFKEALGKLPETEKDWEDVVKIANGRFPSQLNLEKEKTAGETFEKIYKRDPVFANPKDAAAVKIIAYGLRPTARNLNSERAAIRTFRNVFRAAPSSASDWDTARAIAYSGASRQAPPEIPPISIIMMDGNTVSLNTGETWLAGLDYSITAQSIDTRSSPRQVWLALNKDGDRINDAVINEGQIYTYTHRPRGRDPITISAKIDLIWPDADADKVRLKDTSIDSVGTSCISNRQCGAWSACINNTQHRRCYDENNCPPPFRSPATTQSCSSSKDISAGQTLPIAAGYSIAARSIDARSSPRQVWLRLNKNNEMVDEQRLNEEQVYEYKETPGGPTTFSVKVASIWAAAATDMARLKNIMIDPGTIAACAENWQCTNWSACINGQQNRTCSDRNNCADFSSQPVTTRECAMLAE